ncbi:exodeoxyribonuclease VII large subunit [Hazenella coriacea]|uniref:Exodeoxyribonuclease 7 large subunit n=1 Tax=Hazenella coriacea TaxID=1179467 RepID=A0A4R3LB15_9BACL|nr:exodeoxyribonuclease VII large subunit [Hazenella coriacea]TCS96380.1 exodeoxyribonuclease VII large subunit [Hazenella coriacea]
MNQQQKDVWSVTDLVSYVVQKLDSDERLKGVWVEGEISNFSQHTKSRHMYFTLKDETAKIKAAMFAGNNRRLRFMPKDGDRVLVKGYLSMYEREGQVQFYVQTMRSNGEGDLYLAFQRLKERLEAEGLFSLPKKSIPLFPKTVGVITSPSGAAVRDIIITMRRRYPLTQILLYPVSVQGDQAPSEIVQAIEQMNLRQEVDVLIVGRGGGSIEELWAFNEEIVARSIAQSVIPVISAVGHETDTTISDFIADQRAATPTAAAEMVVPHIEDLRERVRSLEQRLLNAQMTLLDKYQQRVKKSVERPIFQYPEARLLQYAQQLDHLESGLERAIHLWQTQRTHQIEQLRYRLQMEHPARHITQIRERIGHLYWEQHQQIKTQIKDRRAKWEQLLSQLDALSPLKVMNRGYSIVQRYHSKELIKSSQQVQPGDLVNIRLADGQVSCQVFKSEGTTHE